MNPSSVTAELNKQGVEDWLIDAVERIARTEDRSLDPYLVTVGDPLVLPNTKATCRCHFVQTDPQGKPRVPALINMLVDQVVDYCIPRTRIDEAQAHLLQTGSTEKVLQLQREARGLFTKIKTSGEGGELLLYSLLEVALGLPQILCKMSLKTSAQVHYHGVDGVHAKALEDGKLAIYWGEAKLYGSVNSAIDAALSSLAPFLLDPGGGAAERDVLLLRDHADTGDEELTAALVRYFSEDTVDATQLVVRGACLIGFTMTDYANPFEGDEVTIRKRVAAAISKWQERAGTAIAGEKLAALELELFFVPVPSVQEFRDLLISKLGLQA